MGLGIGALDFSVSVMSTRYSELARLLMENKEPSTTPGVRSPVSLAPFTIHHSPFDLRP